MADLNELELVHLFVDDLTDYAVVVLDGTDTIRSWNAGARVLLGYMAPEVIGRRFSELYSQMDPLAGESRASITDAAKLGRHETNRELVRKDGTRVKANIVLKPIFDGSEQIVGIGLIAFDIDRLRRIALAVPGAPATVPTPLRGNAKILVVDDNHGVLGIAVDQLTSLGYRAISASSGVEALELLQRDDQIDLLFTDVVMPGEFAGRTLAAKAMEIRPGLKVLFSSGYFEGTLVGEGQLETAVQFLPKPYRKQDLARKIEEVLSAVG
jgi:PAS domain S-box-containing protein